MVFEKHEIVPNDFSNTYLPIWLTRQLKHDKSDKAQISLFKDTRIKEPMNV